MERSGTYKIQTDFPVLGGRFMLAFSKMCCGVEVRCGSVPTHKRWGQACSTQFLFGPIEIYVPESNFAVLQSFDEMEALIAGSDQGASCDAFPQDLVPAKSTAQRDAAAGLFSGS